ncbi:MAG: leucyl aminopeptidase family protein [Rickettsiella sp.]|nr:leucyl aminopeptidase family protein [Rickettsiella sp.]
MPNCFTQQSERSIPIVSIACLQWDAWLSKQTAVIKQWLSTLNFVPKPGCTALLPNNKGELEQVLLVLNDESDFWSFGVLPNVLPKGHYQFKGLKNEKFSHRAAMAWGLGAYEFTRYKKSTKTLTQLFISEKNSEFLNAKLTAIYRVRDLINTPTEDLGPAELAEKVVQLAEKFNATVKQIIGDDLLTENYPAIHAVGRASSRKPRLIDLTWGNPNDPKITLVGKGVCFDSGGLNLKPGSSMLFMKKDMGGAANAIGLAEMIMTFNLPIRLRLLIPAAENLIGSQAYKPGDIIKMRNGLSVEISNTDAEGRLILADALCEADSENPELLIDLATLTGAARAAVGTEISAFFTDHETLASNLLNYSEEERDPIWRLPLYKPYKKLLESKFADMSNSGTSPHAGAITAALFLSSFVREKTPWVHFDFNAYNASFRPGRPEGGEAMAILTLLSYLHSKYLPVK